MRESPALIADANQARGTLTGNGARVGQPDVPPAGRPFLRNAASFFDEYLHRAETRGPLYSTSA